MKRVMDNITKTKGDTDSMVKVKRTAILKIISLFRPKNQLKTELERDKGRIIKEAVSHLNMQSIPVPIARKVQRILEIENSFILGFCETVKCNLDLLFRYLYFTAFLLQVAFQMSDQQGNYVILAACFLIAIVIIATLARLLLNYRVRATNLS